jgi:hypothetical protein
LGIGATVSVFSKNLQQSKQQFLSRGFQSSVSSKLHFGLGNDTKIDSIIVDWKNNKSQKISHLKINSTLNINYKNALTNTPYKIPKAPLFTSVNPSEIGINYQQKENTFNDFDLQLLLPQKQSEKGAALVVADINNDGLDDFFIGNAAGQKASIYRQTTAGNFIETNKVLFDSEKQFEDTDATFLDIDTDGDLDLYVTSGGYELENTSKFLEDRLYINNGKGSFKKRNIPSITSTTKGIAFADFDQDGDQDIFVGSNAKHGQYPLSDIPYFLENKNGTYTNVIDEKFDDISSLRMINDAIFSDFDADGDLDLLVVGEWMPVTFYENKNNKFFLKKMDKISNINGWFQTITASDLDQDGHVDYLIGNWGKNNKFHPTKEKPLHIYADYFDANNSFDIALSKVSKTGGLLPIRGKECSTQQTPFLNNKIKTFKDFASASMTEIYGSEKLENATHFMAHSFASILLKNNGNGQFEIQELPNEAQFSPTLGIEVADINNDGFLDIFGVGNVYDTEVETIRYDASKGYILLGNETGSYEFLKDESYFNHKEAKAIKKIVIKGILHFIIFNKNNKITLLKTNKNKL